MPMKIPITKDFRMVKIEFQPIVKENMAVELQTEHTIVNAADVASYFGA